jgi:sugar lactone lactonase YvrE
MFPKSFSMMVITLHNSTVHRAVAVLAFCFFLFSLISCDDVSEDPQDFNTVSTLAGADTPGLVDGIGSMAKFNNPSGMVIDQEGNLYVSDHSNHVIRKVTPNGVVSTYAGTGIAGFANGQRLNAKFNHPYGLAIDGNGNLYVGDVVNHRIRKISPDGIVTTLAGKRKGFAEGAGSLGRFNHPYGITVDKNNILYVADSYNNRIRKITPGGKVTTVAGNGADGFVDGPGEQAEFYVPIGIVVDSMENIYVGDEGNSSIRKISPDGRVTTLAGNGKFSFSDGVGRNASFNAPGGIAIDVRGNLYVADYLNNCIRRVTPSGEVRKIAGNLRKGFADGIASEAQFYYPFGIAVDAAGVVYVGDQFNHRIRKIE